MTWHINANISKVLLLPFSEIFPKIIFSYQDAIIVEGCSRPFLKGGDSGCLVYIRNENNQKIAFAYGVCEVDALHLPKQHLPTSSTEGDGDTSGKEDSYEHIFADEIDAELKCNVETEDQVECEDEFKLGSVLHRVPASSIDSIGDIEAGKH